MAKTQYIALQPKAVPERGYRPEHYDEALPWCLNPRGHLLHRPREVFRMFKPDGTLLRHEIVHYYCENGTCDSGDLIYIDEPNAGMVVCRRCEANAVAAGLPPSSKIAGRHVHVGGMRVYADCCGFERDATDTSH